MKTPSELQGVLRNLFIKEDPCGIYFKDLDNIDEYDSEIRQIEEEYGSCRTLSEVQDLFLRVFEKQFGRILDEQKVIIRRLAEEYFKVKSKAQPSGLNAGQ